MFRARSILFVSRRPMPNLARWLGGLLVVWVALAAPACDQRVHLGELGDGSANLLWSGTFEPGNLSEWTSDGRGGTYVENTSTAPSPTMDRAHGGQYAGISTVTPMMGMPSASYLYRFQPSPTEAYYSAWYYIPASLTVRGWLSLSHFWCSRTGDGKNLFPMWDVNLYPRVDGSLVAHLYNFVTQTNVEQIAPIPVPIAAWVHLEVLLRKASDATGRIAVWQDGVPILDNPAVITAETPWLQWAVGAASDDVVPTPATVYVDDAAISLTRIGIGTGP